MTATQITGAVVPRLKAGTGVVLLAVAVLLFPAGTADAGPKGPPAHAGGGNPNAGGGNQQWGMDPEDPFAAGSGGDNTLLENWADDTSDVYMVAVGDGGSGSCAPDTMGCDPNEYPDTDEIFEEPANDQTAYAGGEYTYHGEPDPYDEPTINVVYISGSNKGPGQGQGQGSGSPGSGPGNSGSAPGRGGSQGGSTRIDSPPAILIFLPALVLVGVAVVRQRRQRTSYTAHPGSAA
ncbi:MAG: hypothetical protein WEB93_01775 [Sphingomonadales bacterium]